MSFLLDVSDWSELNDRFGKYQAYLASVRDQLAPGAYAFASAPWHYDVEDPRCPHDAWVELVTLTESGVGERHQDRHLDIHVRLLGAYHDGHIELRYSNVASYSFVGQSVQRGHDDWLRDEVRLSEDQLVLHEVVFASGCRWTIRCADLNYVWNPSAGSSP